MALTTIPPAGSKLRASTLSALITEVRPVAARKTANETVNNSATLQNDDHLVVAVAANATYDFTMVLHYTSGTTPDLKIGWTVPSGTTMAWTAAYYDPSLSLGMTSNLTQTTVLALGGSTFNQSTYIHGVIITSSTAGNVQLQWAQNSATGSDTIIYAGSYIDLRRLS